MTAYDPNLNFDAEYKETPLLQKGDYEGEIMSARMVDDSKSPRIEFTVRITSDGYFPDGETAIYGTPVNFMLWLPTEENKDERTSAGNMSKWQSKVNSVKRFIDGMKLGFSTIGEIVEWVESQECEGMDVIARVDIDTYEGNSRNTVRFMNAR